MYRVFELSKANNASQNIQDLILQMHVNRTTENENIKCLNREMFKSSVNVSLVP